MSQIVIVDPTTLSVSDWYFSDSPVVPVTPGIRLQVPDGLTWDMVKGVADSDGNVTLIQDSVKVNAKIQSHWDSLRAERNRRLTACDWTQLPDAPVDRTSWASYRQALRDLPEQVTDPTCVTWPAPPA